MNLTGYAVSSRDSSLNGVATPVAITLININVFVVSGW